MNPVDAVAEFAEACGQRAPLRIRVFNSRSGDIRDLEINRPYTIVGSSPESGIRLDDPEISRVHVYLQVIEGRLACIDLDSRTGLHFGKSSRPRGWLAAGESIHLGPFMLTLLEAVGTGSEPATAVKFSAWDSPGGATVPYVLSFLNAHSRSGQKRICRVVRRITLAGWSDVCNLRLQHHSVERVQCGFVAVGRDLWVVDLQSETGVEVNEQLIECRRLEVKDRVRLGKFHLAVSPTSQGAGWAEEDSAQVDLSDFERDDDVGPPGNRTSSTRLSRAGRGGGEIRKNSGLIPASGLRPANEASPPAPVPATPNGGTTGDPGTLALMQHFQAMQQQFMDHTQQMMTMVVQAFSAAHSRQLDVIRDELQRVHELNRELQELQARRDGAVAAAPESETAAAASAGPSANAPVGAGAAPATAPPGFPPGFGGLESLFPPGFQPPTAGIPPISFPLGGVLPPAAAFPGMPPGGVNPAAAPRMPLPKAAARPAQTAPGPVPSREAAASTDEPDLHVDLTSRISELERERTGRWQRILQMLTASGGT